MKVAMRVPLPLPSLVCLITGLRLSRPSVSNANIKFLITGQETPSGFLLQACFHLTQLALGQGTQTQRALRVSAELSWCHADLVWVGSPSLPNVWAPAAAPLKHRHPCSFASVKAPGKRLLGRAELRCEAVSLGCWEGRANNGALEPGKSCRIRWACWSWVRAGKASAGSWCLYWNCLKAFLEGTISGDSAGSLLLVTEEHSREATLGRFCTAGFAFRQGFHCSGGQG